MGIQFRKFVSSVNPFQLLPKDRPEFRWVIGAVAVVAICTSLVEDKRVLVLGCILFAVFGKVLHENWRKPTDSTAQDPFTKHTFAWYSLVMIMLIGLLFGTSVFFGRPLELRNWIEGSHKGRPSLTIHALDEGDGRHLSISQLPIDATIENTPADTNIVWQIEGIGSLTPRGSMASYDLSDSDRVGIRTVSHVRMRAELMRRGAIVDSVTREFLLTPALTVHDVAARVPPR